MGRNYWESFSSCIPASKESAALGICKAIFGRDVLIETYPFPVIDPILFALPLSIIVIILVSLLTSKK